MWVLEPRENAEKVGYPVVWEEQKDASNVIDYQINEEITKDASGVINANNDTTTGMATVIPWINAPKLIATTSIYWDLWGWWGETKLWWDIYTNTPLSNTDPTKDFKTFTLSNLWGDKLLSQWSGWIVLPVWWWYEFTFTFPTGWGTFKVDTVVKTKNWLTFYTDYWSYNSTPHTATFKWKVEANDELYVQCTLTYTGSSDHFSYTRDMSWTITKM